MLHLEFIFYDHCFSSGKRFILTVESSEVDAQVRVGIPSFRFKSNLTSHSHISWKKLTLISPSLMKLRGGGRRRGKFWSMVGLIFLSYKEGWASPHKKQNNLIFFLLKLIDFIFFFSAVQHFDRIFFLFLSLTSVFLQREPVLAAFWDEREFTTPLLLSLYLIAIFARVTSVSSVGRPPTPLPCFDTILFWYLEPKYFTCFKSACFWNSSTNEFLMISWFEQQVKNHGSPSCWTWTK